jgi:hypothetical protein
MRCVSVLSVLGLIGGACNAFSSPTMSAATPKRTLFDIPVSNNGARCRIIIYKVSAEHVDRTTFSTYKQMLRLLIDFPLSTTLH